MVTPIGMPGTASRTDRTTASTTSGLTVSSPASSLGCTCRSTAPAATASAQASAIWAGVIGRAGCSPGSRDPFGQAWSTGFNAHAAGNVNRTTCPPMVPFAVTLGWRAESFHLSRSRPASAPGPLTVTAATTSAGAAMPAHAAGHGDAVYPLNVVEAPPGHGRLLGEGDTVCGEFAASQPHAVRSVHRQPAPSHRPGWRRRPGRCGATARAIQFRRHGVRTGRPGGSRGTACTRGVACMFGAYEPADYLRSARVEIHQGADMGHVGRLDEGRVWERSRRRAGALRRGERVEVTDKDQGRNIWIGGVVGTGCTSDTEPATECSRRHSRTGTTPTP